MTTRNPTRRARMRFTASLVALVVASACTGEEESSRRIGPTLQEMATAVGADGLQVLRNGYVRNRSGEILVIPKPWNVLSHWEGGLNGSRDPQSSHATPWSYHQRVPIVLYGPGYVRPGLEVNRPVGTADIAPTLAALLGLPFDAPDGSVLRESLSSGKKDRPPPRAIVVVVYDGGGWNVLQQWPDAWPNERRLMEAGSTYTNAIVGSAPSVTAPVHATLGTGAYPRTHGISENRARRPDGMFGDLTQDAELRWMYAETLADVWDRTTNNQAWVGMLGYETWHLLMMGRGAASPGGDPDVGILWNRYGGVFQTNELLYVRPDSLPPPSTLDAHLRELDISDGAADGYWHGRSLDPALYQFSANPAFARYQGEAAAAIAGAEPIGLDEVTDLYFVEMKTGDIAGHIWNMVHPDFQVSWRVQDDALGELVRVLDRRIGTDRYVLVVTADHGQTPLPEESGGLRIERLELAADLEAAFGPVVQELSASDVFLDLEEVEERGVSVEEIARWIGDYRYEDGMPPGARTAGVPESVLRQRVFAAALPGDWVAALSPAEISAMGAGAYPESDLTSPSIRVYP